MVPAPLLASSGESPAARTLAELARTVGWRVTRTSVESADAVVVATMGHGDEDSSSRRSRAGAGYVGLVASAQARRQRARRAPRQRARRGGGRCASARPAGLDLGPSTQEEIAVAILAELVAWRHTRAGESPVPPAEAVDPVCGMTVAVGPATEQIEHEGATVFFCSAHCRRAFRGRARAVQRRESAVRDVLETLERWAADGAPVAIATVVGTERSAPRDPGAVLAVSESGEVAGSVTGGCVEPAVYGEAREVLAGGAPRLKTYGIADEEAFEVGLPCGGTVHIFVDRLDPELVAPIAEAVREERPIALEIRITGDDAGAKRLVTLDDDGPAAELLARGDTGIVDTPEGQIFVSSFAPRPNMYVFGAVDHAAALASIGRFLGYRVTVCDARAKFVTPERFPDVDELVVEWPDKFLAQRARRRAHGRSASSRTTTSSTSRRSRSRSRPRPATSARWAARRTNEDRAERLRAEGVSDEDIARIHAPIGLKIGSRTPEEVAVAIAAQIVQVMRSPKPQARGGLAA